MLKARLITFFILFSCFILFNTYISDAQQIVNPDDIRQAEKFLSSLPEACIKSYRTTNNDGSISLYILCNGNGQSTDGLIVIKNGVVTKIR